MDHEEFQDFSIEMPRDGWPTEDAKHIFDDLMEEWAREFLKHNVEYRGQRREFGKIGELIEMTRKLNKLKAAWWEGEDTSQWRESPDTILKELISHAFLAFVSIRHPSGPDRAKTPAIEDVGYVRMLAGQGVMLPKDAL
jgi:hypothetical protein